MARGEKSSMRPNCLGRLHKNAIIIPHDAMDIIRRATATREPTKNSTSHDTNNSPPHDASRERSYG